MPTSVKITQKMTQRLITDSPRLFREEDKLKRIEKAETWLAAKGTCELSIGGRDGPYGCGEGR